MKLAIGCLMIALAASIAAATSCTHEVASDWPYTKPEPCDTVACAQAQAAEEAYANCVAVSQFDSSRTCVKPPRRLKRDVDLVCTSSETCTVFTDSRTTLCCAWRNLMVGNFRDDTGGSGNVFLPIYTMPNGDVTTVTPASTATAKAGDETSSTPASVATTKTSASQSGTGTVAAGTHSSVSSGSPSVNTAPAHQTGGAASRSSVHVALLVVAVLPIVVAVI